MVSWARSSPELHHLEVGKPGCRDNGEALGEYRTGELAGAIKALGVKKQFFLGQEPVVAEGALPLYRDSGMAWGPEGKPVANPVAAADSLTAQPLEPQAQALVAAIRALTRMFWSPTIPDGGYGHPDHVRVYEIVHRALQILEDDEDRPILTWGIEGEFDAADQRLQAAIYGDGTAKRKAMEAHRTQITVVDEKTFEYSNKVPQKISAVETFRVLDGDPTATVRPKPQEAGLVSSLLTGSILGILPVLPGRFTMPGSCAGIPPCPSAYGGVPDGFLHSTVVCPVVRRGYGGSRAGVFVTVYVLGYGRPDSPFVLVNPSHSAIGLYGALWWFGAPVAAMLGMLVYTRNR